MAAANTEMAELRHPGAHHSAGAAVRPKCLQEAHRLGRPAPCLPSSRRSSIIRMLLSTSSSASPARVQQGLCPGYSATSVLVPQSQQRVHSASTRDTHMPADSDKARQRTVNAASLGPGGRQLRPAQSLLLGRERPDRDCHEGSGANCVYAARLLARERGRSHTAYTARNKSTVAGLQWADGQPPACM